jgi:hypothetical protein
MRSANHTQALWSYALTAPLGFATLKSAFDPSNPLHSDDQNFITLQILSRSPAFPWGIFCIDASGASHRIGADLL